MSKSEIAKRLKVAREMSGLSQGQAAKKLGMHRPTVSEIEAGRRSLKSEELVAFSNLYKVEINWIAKGKFNEDKVEGTILAAARELSSMRDEDIQELMNTIKMIKNSEE